MADVRSFTAVALAAASLACGGGSEAGGVAEQATVRGTLTQAQAFSVAGQVSFAVQWMGAEYSDPIVNHANRDLFAPDPQFVTTCVESDPVVGGTCDGTPTSGRESCHVEDVLATALLQPVRYDAQFPISFAVPVQGAPPAAALYDLGRQGGTGVYAMGTVLAFVDSDGDGAVRLGTPGVAGEAGLADSAYQDYAPAEGAPRRSYFVTYLRGTIHPESIFPGYAEVLLHVPQGYAIWLKEEWVDAYGRRLSVRRSAEPIETPVELVSRAGIAGSAAWCRAYDVETSWVAEIPAGAVPEYCWGNGLGAYWSRRTHVAACTYREERYEASFTCGGTPPAWSCPGT